VIEIQCEEIRSTHVLPFAGRGLAAHVYCRLGEEITPMYCVLPFGGGDCRYVLRVGAPVPVY
jgi:hypothetical protein